MSDTNPVSLMNSVEAMDLLNYARHKLRKDPDHDRPRLARFDHQVAEHKQALKKHIEPDNSKVDEFEPIEPGEIKHVLTPAPNVSKVAIRRAKKK